jgi:probable F420-dependent oxidoreductase
MDLHFGATLSAGLEATAASARRLEDLGFEYAATGEHFMRGNPPQATGTALPVLGVAAGATTRIRLLSSILLAPLYHPVMLAKLAATLDVASGGRLTLGVGIGGEFPVEFAAMGVPVKERGARTDESLPLLKRLWTEPHVNHAGRFYRLEDVTLSPPPAQRPHPPIWVSGRRDGAMRRAARFGDGWLPYFYSPVQYRESVAKITAIAAEHGRDLSRFQWAHFAFISIADTREEAARIAAERLGARYSSRSEMLSLVGSYCILGSVPDCLGQLEAYIEAGARHIVFAWYARPDDIPRQMEIAAREIAPELRRRLGAAGPSIASPGAPGGSSGA